MHGEASLPDDFPECQQFEGLNREICRGQRLPRDRCNALRKLWKLPPLPGPDGKSTLPPLVIRGWNFAQAMTRWSLAGMPRRTQEEIDERLAICQSCEFLQNNHCTKCGCACIEKNRLMNKLALATESCPIGRW